MEKSISRNSTPLKNRWCSRRFFLRWHLLIVIATMTLCSACAQKEVKPLGPQPGADEILFSNAEQLFKQKSYSKALPAYQAYVAQYPRKPMADAALMKLGMIFSAEGNFERERNAYQRLVVEYPKSAYVSDAQMAILSSYYREGNYPAAMDQAKVLLKDIFLPKIRAVRIHILLGDIYTITGPAREAVNAYAMAYEQAQPSDQPAIWKQFESAVSQLESSDIEAYAASPPQGDLGKFLFYQIGKSLVEAERNKDAVLILTRFVELFPAHPQIAEVRGLLEGLSRKAAPKQYVIGCLLPLTGSYKTYGEQALKGIELALSQVSERKGGTPVEIVVKDTASDAAKATAAVRELCDGQAAAIIGPIVNAVEAAAEAAQKCGIPIITLTGKEGITDIGNYVFRNFITPQMQVASLVPYVTKKRGLKRFAVLYPEEKYGTTLMNLFWDKVIENGGVITGVESYKPNATDFAEPIKRLVGRYYETSQGGGKGSSRNKSAAEGAAADATQVATSAKGEKKAEVTVVDFDALFIPDTPAKIGAILPQLSFFDADKVVFLGTNLWHSQELIQSAEGKLQGAVVPDAFFAESELPHVKAFVEAFKATYNATPGFVEAISYDTAMMLFGLAEKSMPIERGAVRDQLAAIKDFSGVTGQTSFNEKGDATKDLYLLEIHLDRFRALSTGN